MQWPIQSILIAAVMIIAGLGLLYIMVKRAGIPIPGWIWEVIGIVILAFVIIIGIRLVFSF